MPNLFRTSCLHFVVICHSNDTPRKNRHYGEINLERSFQTFVALYHLFYPLSKDIGSEGKTRLLVFRSLCLHTMLFRNVKKESF